MTTVEAFNHQNKKLAWGPQIDLSGLDYLYPPQNVKPYTPPPPGVDNLGISSTDSFLVPNVGEFTVNFEGYVRVARSQPTSNEWNTSDVFTNLIDMCMRGEESGIGEIIVTLNPDVLSTGQLRTPHADLACEKPSKACRMAVGALFKMPLLNLTLFNKEPIELTIDDVRMIPPAGNPGEGRIYQILPLFHRENPDGLPAAYLTSLQFRMGHYITEAKIQGILQG
ncbi:hypothetical protein DSM106972_057090 [Dulcicalothrix desertica PCC 7102]|uniref:Uncharacterized protein n=1 Tax=Dulcicalothrix desertica PCC 7102 TaxID=232991 RepID=A0A3S1B142_9CYAN|nr:DUF6073 family protein [Dulcicalothrix desertica]RUT02789.1 hypothetical protein DSM106972_057090 [Dulcicalothrix desertica PCC 7102]TWH38977.1 hypothetical protein CAL7102_08180 [Dulcicalothrix desertica PCC 7102]